MNCDSLRECMMDVLYGEERDSRVCFEFFRHLEGCSDCKNEYLELIETREILSDWRIGESSAPLEKPDRSHRTELAPVAMPSSTAARESWFNQTWAIAQRIAAIVLVVEGAISLLGQAGLEIGGGEKLRVSQDDLVVLVSDMMESKLIRERDQVNRSVLRTYESWDLGQREAFMELATSVGYLQRALDDLRGASEEEGLERLERIRSQ